MMNMRSLKLTDAEKKYLNDMMSKVSRSFAIVVLSLEEPLNGYLAAAYLICRVVDNIEDCTQPFAWKQQRFGEFHRLIEEPASAPQILAVWSQESWPGLTQDELAMMGHGHGLMLWEIYAQIPERSRASIRRWAAEMADGMLRVENPDQHPLLEDRGGVRVLAAESDYNAYCFYVAGTVGHMATELVVVHYGLADDVATRLVGHLRSLRSRPAEDQYPQGFRQRPRPGLLLSAVHLASRSRFCPAVVGRRAGAVEEKSHRRRGSRAA